MSGINTDSIILTLSSKSTLIHNPNNTHASFKIHLPGYIKCEPQWEMALLNIQYPFNWHNLEEQNVAILANVGDPELLAKFSDQCDISQRKYINENPSMDRLVSLIDQYNDEFHSENPLPYKVIQFPKAYYSTSLMVAEALFKEFNRIEKVQGEEFPAEFCKLSVEQNDLLNTLEFGKEHLNGIQIATLNDQLPNALGLNNEQPIPGLFLSNPWDNLPKKEPVLDRPFSFYVYCDAIRHQIFDGRLYALLAVVPIKGNPGSQCFATPNPITYITVTPREVYNMEFKICKWSGEPFPFEKNGFLEIQLHLRRRWWY